MVPMGAGREEVPGGFFWLGVGDEWGWRGGYRL